MTDPKDETSAMEPAPAELMADPMLKLWHLLDAAKTEWLASDEPCDEKTALARAILAEGWRPPLPGCGCQPFDFCEKCWGPEQRREAAIRQLAYCEEVIPSGPEDAEQCPNPREPGSVHCAQHQPRPLPDSETEPDAMQWGYREHPAEIIEPVLEKYARFRAQDDHLKLVQREVRYGPWIEVTS